MNPLKHTFGRIVIKIDIEGKNWHTFTNGTKIRLERQFNNLNRRETEPVNATVVSAENIPENAEVLIHPNSVHNTNKIFNYERLSGQVEGSDIKYYSIPEEQCFIWKDENRTWQPIYPYETALRVFKPYKGVLQGINPSIIKDTLYVTSGSLKGKVVATLKAVDYVCIFQDSNGKEGQLIRWRPNGDERTGREPEAIAILWDKTKQVEKGELLVGIEVKDCKTIDLWDK